MKILVALSGGVDSSTSLALLHERAQKGDIQKLEAAYIKTWMHEENPIGECSWREDIADAEAVCSKLGVPFRIINLIGEYEKHVVKMLVEGYARGITPNPDIACNRFIKFGAFLDIATSEGFTHLATGHYARISPSEDNSYFKLLEGADPNKDQSYFLAQLNQSQLARALFPVGELLKPQVREVAKRFALPNADKKDSQGICFLGKVKINDFLARYLPDAPGAIINLAGKEVGQHKGLHHYTIGQRHGMGIPSNTDGEHYVVISKNFATNTLHVGFDHPTTPGLYGGVFRLHHLHAINPDFFLQASASTSKTTSGLTARPRYRDPKIPCTLELHAEKGEGTLTFSTPQRALASGQVVAFYNDAELIGSGIYL
jgi:tRNA-specific 2-thiouridylase